VGGEVALLLAALAAYDPNIDAAVKPWTGLGVSAGVQRLHDDFGVFAEVESPRFFEDRLSLRLAGGVGWFADLRALPMGTDDDGGGAWSPYGHLRLGLDFAVPIALPTGRLYATAGPSLIVLGRRLSTTRVGVGGFGAAGIEIFAGDGLQSFPIAFYFEIGAVAHTGAADVENRTGAAEASDSTVDRPIATGFLMQGGVRFYLWR